MDHEAPVSGPAAERHRAANSDGTEPGHSVGQQLLETDPIGRHARGQNPTAVRQRVATPQDFARKVIRRNDPLPPIQVNHTQPPDVKQLSQGRAEHTGVRQRLTQPDKLPNVGHESLDHRELTG